MIKIVTVVSGEITCVTPSEPSDDGSDGVGDGDGEQYSSDDGGDVSTPCFFQDMLCSVIKYIHFVVFQDMLFYAIESSHFVVFQDMVFYAIESSHVVAFQEMVFYAIESSHFVVFQDMVFYAIESSHVVVFQDMLFHAIESSHVVVFQDSDPTENTAPALREALKEIGQLAIAESVFGPSS